MSSKPRRIAQWLFTCLAALGASGGCGVDSDPTTNEETTEETSADSTEEATGTSEEALTGWTDADECNPFGLQLFDRSETISAALVNNAAFRSCVVDRFQESYLDCYDNASFPTYAQAANGALDALAQGTHINLNCTNREGGVCGVGGACPAGTNCQDGFCAGTQDSAGIGTYLQWQPTLITIGGFWTRSNWFNYVVPTQAANPAYPWDATADTIAHEFAHTQGYDHVYDETCAQNLRGRPYYAYGEPSAPYIIGECAVAAIGAIYRDGGDLWSCDPDHVNLPTTYNPAPNDPTDNNPALRDSFSGATCTRTLRHRVAISTWGGQFIQATNRGGSTVTVNSPGPGDWETFYIIDSTRGELVNSNTVQIRAGDGHYLRADPTTGDIRADGTSYNDPYSFFILTRYYGTGTVQPGDYIRLKNTQLNRYVTAVGGGGSGLRADATTIGANQEFYMEEPNRRQAVSLDVGTQRVAFVFDSTRLLSRRTASAIGTDAARDEMFWVHDYSGGDIEDNDIISFEWSREPTFMASCLSGTGNVRGDHFWATNNCGRFVIQRVSGTGPIVNGTQVRLYSIGAARYLVSSGTNRIAASATTAATASTFTVRFSQDSAY
ncbi:MAG: hypothetical protein HOW73_05070 [Polyangiaceae bacterium]|nr:hypothetical protein [Polyangiaceae bacterium]